jgi:hypothetical protein
LVLKDKASDPEYCTWYMRMIGNGEKKKEKKSKIATVSLERKWVYLSFSST